MTQWHILLSEMDSVTNKSKTKLRKTSKKKSYKNHSSFQMPFTLFCYSKKKKSYAISYSNSSTFTLIRGKTEKNENCKK